MKIRLVGADGRMDRRRNMAKLMVAFRSFVSAPENEQELDQRGKGMLQSSSGNKRESPAVHSASTKQIINNAGVQLLSLFRHCIFYTDL